MSKYEVIVLFNGYSTQIDDDLVSNCTSTLLKSETTNIIIDTRTPWDGDSLIKALLRQNITPDNINYCICTHGHTDHVGCNYLFKNALHIVGKNCISRKDVYTEHDFKEPYVIDEHVKVIATPGHTSECITVLVETEAGLVAIAGDLFEKQEDLENDELWTCCSELPDVQVESRRKVMDIADFIVPGHGPMFKNNNKIVPKETNLA